MKTESFPIKMNLKAKTYNLKPNSRGQSLAEILIAVAVGAIIIGSAAVGISLLLRSNLDSRSSQTASFLAREYLDKARSLSESNWHNIYDLSPKGATSAYKIVASGTTGLAIASGTESSTIENITYTRYFTVENIRRDASDNIVESGGTWDDPSTQKITAVVQWPSGGQTQGRSRRGRSCEHPVRCRCRFGQSLQLVGHPSELLAH